MDRHAGWVLWFFEAEHGGILMAQMQPNKPKQPIKSTDRRRLTKPVPSGKIKQPKAPPSLAEVDDVYKQAAMKPFKSIFNDRRPPSAEY